MMEFVEEALEVDATTEEATEASLSLLDSPGETLRFFRFLRGLPFNFGAENTVENYSVNQSVPKVSLTLIVLQELT